LFGNLTLEDLEKDDYISSIRNKLLAEAFYLTGDIEKYGTGFIRIRKKLNELKTATYKISEIGDFLKIELMDTRSYDSEKDVENRKCDVEKDVEKKFDLSKNHILIIKSILENKNVTQKNLSKIVGITLRNIQNNMKKLKEMGVLKRIGSDKGGYWKVLVKPAQTDTNDNGLI